MTEPRITERAVTFRCGEQTLLGVLQMPEKSTGDGVLVVVGGPQYRVGSHRQFVLLGRFLASQGIATFRFDHAGIGDSSGRFQGFQTLDEDIQCAIEEFYLINKGMQRLYIWGLCDAASAALLSAYKDSRVDGLILLNPWVRSETGLARTIIKTYYLQRLLSMRFWRELISGRLNVRQSILSFVTDIRKALLPQESVADTPTEVVTPPDQETASTKKEPDFVESMLLGLRKFSGRVMIVVSGNDITGAEFCEVVKTNRRWRSATSVPSVTWKMIPEANHTFSTKAWRGEVERATADWILQK